MKVSFRIDYQIGWGQTLCVAGSTLKLGQWNPQRAIPLQPTEFGGWILSIELDPEHQLEYKYLIRTDPGMVIWESGENRQILLDRAEVDEVFCRDFWHTAREGDRSLRTAAFTNSIMKRSRTNNPVSDQPPFTRTLRLQIHAPRVGKNQCIGILGDHAQMGSWMENAVIRMDDRHFPLWSVDLDATHLRFPFQYKYVIFSESGNKVLVWEQGNNRVIREFPLGKGKTLKIHTDEVFRYPENRWRGAGVALPLFSVRTNKSGGIGEYDDLKKVVDWAVATRMKLIQLLPLNETVATHSWIDSYPYKAISSMALHPVYLNIFKMGILEDENLMNGFVKALAGFEACDTVHYDEVHKVKSKYFKLIFDQNSGFEKDLDYQHFFDQSREWLIPYAAFCYLRDQYGTANFRNWPDYQVYDPEKIEQLCHPSKEWYPHIAVHYFIQWHAHRQLSEATAYARQHGIVLKGSLPMGISSDSVEAWIHPDLFNLDQQAGTPPDEYADLGQNWGYPTYNWERMASDHYKWWTIRLKHMAIYFDAVQFDHLLGFFRVWEIPISQLHGVMGHFNPAIPYTRDELLDKGITFNEERYTKPYIRDYFLWELFGEETLEVKKKYLMEYEPGKYNLKEQFDSQMKVWRYFEGANARDHLCGRDIRIRDGLCTLISEVLFVRDPKHPAQFHPRIALQNTNSYLNLPADMRYRMDELYSEYFYSRQQEYWRQMAVERLSLVVQESNLLIFGEITGDVPECIPKVLKDLGILNLVIQRIPKDPDIEFGDPKEAPYLSVCTTSTHDLSTLRGWWEEDRQKSQRFYTQILGQQGTAPYFMEPWIARLILNQHLNSPSMWTIFPIQDWLAIDGNLRWDNTEGERINIPAIANHYWRYRMHLKMEDLIAARAINGEITSMIKTSGRDLEY